MKQAKLTMDFVTGLRGLENAPREKGDKLIRAIGSHVGEALIVGNEDGPGTPVDTGNARGHWYATIGEADPGNPNPTPEGVAASQSLAAAQVGLVAATAQLGDVVSFNNDAAYIEELNNGSSQQAPAGMTDVVASNFERIVRTKAQELGIYEGG